MTVLSTRPASEHPNARSPALVGIFGCQDKDMASAD